jgi:hypothetical protein
MTLSLTPSKVTQQSTSSDSGATTVVKAAVTPDVQNALLFDQSKGSNTPNNTGQSALSQKTQGKYSNKQLMAPFNYQINVEGVLITVDYLGKKIITKNNTPYRSIASLSATTLPITLISDPFQPGTGNRLIKQAPSQKAATKIYNTGNNAVSNSINGRYNVFEQPLQPTTIFNNLQSSGGAALQGVLKDTKAFTNINQTIAKLPGFSVITNALGQIPGGTNIAQALANPVGAVGGLAQSVAGGLNLQASLPSGSLGSLGSVFSVASDLASSGPPTSLTGAIALGKQVKGIVCNFKLPSITIPPGFPGSITDTFKGFSLGGLLSNFGKQASKEAKQLEDQIKKEYEDTMSNIKNQISVVKELARSIPKQLEAAYRSAIKEITTCDKNPNNANNTKSGQAAAPPPPSPTLAATDMNGNFNGFANAEGAKILAQTSGPTYGLFGEAGLQNKRPTIGF